MKVIMRSSYPVMRVIFRLANNYSYNKNINDPTTTTTTGNSSPQLNFVMNSVKNVFRDYCRGPVVTVAVITAAAATLIRMLEVERRPGTWVVCLLDAGTILLFFS